MRWVLAALLAILVSTKDGPVLAADVDWDRLADARKMALERQLWTRSEWLGLVHYKARGDQWVSGVDDPRFFNSGRGSVDPESELLATLAALDAAGPDDNAHAQCRFPARFEWLRRELGEAWRSVSERSCTEYREWRAGIPDGQLTLVFPAYHLNSPSSMFGHTLLRLDPADLDASSDWLSIAVNFGAEVRADDNSIFYAFKGLTGGYPGFFIVSPYYKKIREYNIDEKRDIWEYPLDLRAEEIRFMATHLWELKEMRFDYFFFDENCSYRLLELIEVARPGLDLTKPFGVTAIPVDTVRAIEDARLIRSAAYRPSEVTVLEHLLERIPADHHRLVELLAEDPDGLEGDEFRHLDAATQRSVVEASYRLLRHRRGGGPRDPVVARNSYRLLARLNSYPVANAPDVPPPARPESGHGSRRALLAAGYRNGAHYVDLGYRMAFHSLEDGEAGFLRGAQINIGNLELRATGDRAIRLLRLDLADIFSLTPRSALFSPWSWRVYGGLERQWTEGDDVLVAHATGGAGVAYAPLPGNIAYGMATLRVENNRQLEHRTEPAVGMMLGSVQHFKSGTAHLLISTESFASGVQRRRASYAHTVSLDVHQAVRIQFQRNEHDGRGVNDVGIAYQRHFW